MKFHRLFLVFLLLLPGLVTGQIEKVVVETYYVSDSLDATDTTGGGLEPGSRTYRIFIDLAPGSKLRKIYGDVNHTLKFSSTSNFFNNKADGQTFAKEFSKSRYGDNTVALDTWLTLGQTTRIGAKTYFGVPKSMDDDGSFIGGANNDGGSAGVPTGLLTNADPEAGIPLTTSDGMDTMVSLPANWVDSGFIDPSTLVDSTIFGSLIIGNHFISNDAYLLNQGVSGVNSDSNYVLVAQLTTKGEISFELNVEVEELYGSGTRIVQYVANDSILLHDATHDEYLSPFLKYPASCGCTDPDYLEYSAEYSCSDPSDCQTPILFGCMDTLACNYNSSANYHLQSLCCYPGNCNDRDIAVVCPTIAFHSRGFSLYPDPVPQHATLRFDAGAEGKHVRCDVMDCFGKTMFQQDLGTVTGLHNSILDLSVLAPGIYLIRLSVGEQIESKLFIKN